MTNNISWLSSLLSTISSVFCSRPGWRPALALRLVLLAAVLAACETSSRRESVEVSIERDRTIVPLDPGRTITFAKTGSAARVSLRTERDGDGTKFAVIGKPGQSFASMAWRGSDLVMKMEGRHEAVLLRLPGRVGSSWTAAPGIRATVLPDARITVPAGTFACVVIRLAEGPSVRETYWLCPGVGFVRVVREAGGKRDEAVLASP